MAQKKKQTDSGMEDSKELSQGAKDAAKERADTAIIRELRTLYETQLLPIERKFMFSKFRE